MRKILRNSVISLSILLLGTGCTYKKSLGVNVNPKITEVNMDELKNMKKGEACLSRFLFIPTSLDATVRKAANSVGIKKIKYQEYSNTEAIIFGSSCVIVYGE